MTEDGDAGRTAGFEIAQDDYVAACGLAARMRMWSWRGAPIFGLLFGGLMAIGGDWTADLVVAPTAALAWGWLMLRFNAWGIARDFRQRRDLQGRVELAWSETTFMWRSPTTEERAPWPNFRRWREDARTILLYRSECAFSFVPKRALTAAQVDDLRQLAARSGLKGAAGS